MAASIVLGSREALGGPLLINPAEIGDFCPGDVPAWDNRGPQGASALLTYAVLLVFLLKKGLIRIVKIWDTVVRALLQNGLPAVGAGKMAAPVQGNGRIAHIAIPGPFLAEHREDALISRLVHGIEPVKFRDAPDYHGVGVRQGLPYLPHPLPGHMGGTHHQVECLLGSSPALCRHKAMQRTQGCGADFG